MRLSVRAAMDMLPITTPDIWSDEQIIEVLRTHKLLQLVSQNQEKYDMFLKEINKRGLFEQAKPANMDIGEWREYGWFYITWGNSILGFTNNKSSAEMVRARLIKDFAETGLEPEFITDNNSQSSLIQNLMYHASNAIREQSEDWTSEGGGHSDWDRTDALQESDNKAHKHGLDLAEAAKSHPLYKGRRKQLAEGLTSVNKAPDNFKPSKKSVITGGTPTKENTVGAWVDENDYFHKNPEADYESFIGRTESFRRAEQAREQFEEDFVKQIVKKVKISEEGLDPDKLADDFTMASLKPQYRLIFKTAARPGVMEEYIWLWSGGRFATDKNVENGKELKGVSHYGLAVKNGIKNVSDRMPRGFVTFYDDESVEIQTYGESFWKLPSRLQSRIESYFGLTPGKYKVAPPIAMARGGKNTFASLKLSIRDKHSRSGQ